MDLKAEKLSLIEWLAGIEDERIIRQFKTLQRSNQEELASTLSDDEKSVLDQGLRSIEEGRVHAHQEVMQFVRAKFPNLFE